MVIAAAECQGSLPMPYRRSSSHRRYGNFSSHESPVSKRTFGRVSGELVSGVSRASVPDSSTSSNTASPKDDGSACTPSEDEILRLTAIDITNSKNQRVWEGHGNDGASSPGAVVSALKLRKARRRCSKCGSTSHIFKECPSERKCVRCCDIGCQQTCATVVIRTGMMKKCREKNDLSGMWRLLSSMWEDGHKPTVHSYSLLLSLLASRGQVEEAGKVWRRMEEDGVAADIICFNALLNGWCSTGKMDQARAVLKEMRGKGFHPSTSSYNTMIKGLGLAGQATEASKVVQQMLSDSGAKPNRQTYNSLMNAWALMKDVVQVRRVLQLMREAGISPDVVTFNTLAKAYTQVGRCSKAEQVITEMQDSNVLPNERTYGIIISGYCTAGNPLKGLSFLNRMKMNGVLCNLAIYNILVKGFAELYELDNVDKVLNLMQADGLKPDVQSFSLIMNPLCSSGLVKEAQIMFEKMKKGYRVRPDVTAYSILAKGYVRARCIKEAEGLLLTMRSEGVEPNVLTYTTVISGWCSEGKMEDALRVFNDMQGKGVSPNVNTFTTLIWGFSESKQPHRAEEILETMKKRGFKPDRKCLELVAEAWRLVGLPGECRRVLGEEADVVCEGNSLAKRFESMIARREVYLDSDIYRTLNVESDRAKRVPFSNGAPLGRLTEKIASVKSASIKDSSQARLQPEGSISSVVLMRIPIMTLRRCLLNRYALLSYGTCTQQRSLQVLNSVPSTPWSPIKLSSTFLII